MIFLAVSLLLILTSLPLPPPLSLSLSYVCVCVCVRARVRVHYVRYMLLPADVVTKLTHALSTVQEQANRRI